MARRNDRMIEAEILPEDLVLQDELAKLAASFLGEGTLYVVNPGVGFTDLDLLTYLDDPSWNAPRTVSVNDRVLSLL